MLQTETIVSAALAACICLSARPIAAPIGLVDQPDGVRKLHPGSPPLLGGLAVLPGLVWSFFEAQAGFVVGIAVSFFILGLLDDLFTLSARLRLAIGGLLTLFMLWETPEMAVHAFYFTGNVFVPLGVLAVPFTAICILGLVNSLNMVDGTNGLLAGLSVLWASFLLLHAAPHLSLTLFGLLAALIVTLAFNFRGKIFLGDSGAYMLGAALGAAAIWLYNLSPHWSADGVVLLFAVPVVDCLRVMVARVASGRSPMTPDRNHLHHLLVDNWPKGVLLIYWALVGVPNVAAFWFPGLTPLWLGLCLAAYAGLVGYAKARLGRRSAAGKERRLGHAAGGGAEPKRGSVTGPIS